MTVIADTSPLNYLVLIGEVSVLPRLYERVIIPRAVQEELIAPGTPPPVRAWAADPPPWLDVRQIQRQDLIDRSDELDPGEREAIALAQSLRAELVIIDYWAGRKAARLKGLIVTGTLGVLHAASERELIDLSAALRRLRQTSFHVSPAVLEALVKSATREPPESSGVIE